MIDSGDITERNLQLRTNLSQYLDSVPNSFISKILLTHGHFDHFGGVSDVVKMLKKRGQTIPKVFKMLDMNDAEQKIFGMYPDLKREGDEDVNSDSIIVKNILDGDVFGFE